MKLDGVVAIRETEALAVHEVNLGVEGEVRREALGERRVNALLRVTDYERRGGRRAGFVLHAEPEFARRQGGEEHVRLIAEADVLGALADAEGNLRLPFAGVAAVELDDAVFEVQAAECRVERLGVIGLEIEPEVLARRHRHMGGMGAKFPIGGGLDVRGIVDGLRVRAHPEQGRRSAGLVVNLDQKLPPAALDEFRFGGAGGDLDAHLRADLDAEEAIGIEDLLHRADRGAGIARLHGGGEALLVGGAERSAEVVGRVEQASYLREQGLGLDFGDER